MQPGSLRRSFPASPAHDGHRAHDQEPSNVALPHLRNPPENLFASGRVLPGRKPEPGGKVAPAFEDAHRRRKGLDRNGRDRPHARHGLEAARRRSASGFVNGRVLEFGNPLRQPVDLLEKNARQFHDKKGKQRRRLLDRFCENLHIRRPLRSHDAMLGQMTAYLPSARRLFRRKLPRPR
jgi:hypothetical protein